MPISPRILTGTFVVATALTAAGLNISVLGIGAGTSAVAAVESSPQLSSTDATPPASAAVPVANLAAGAVTAAVMPSSGADPGEPVPAADSPTATVAVVVGDPTISEPTSTKGPATQPTSAAPTTAAPTTAAPTTAAPATEAPTTAAPTTPAVADSPVETIHTNYVTVEFDGVADVIVAVHDGEWIEFWSADTEPGWAYRLDDDQPDRVKIKFRPTSGGDEAEMVIRLDDGELIVKKEY